MESTVSAIGASPASLTQASDRASITREQFLGILMEELTNQDPLNPLDNGQFVQQLVGLQSLEQTAALTDSLSAFQRFMEMASASGLIGKTVRGRTLEGGTVEGVVSKVVMENGKVSLVVGAEKISMNSVTEIVAGGIGSGATGQGVPAAG